MSRWDGIEEFVAVATAGSFAKGAESLNVSASHVSRAVAALEKRIQAQLFFRTTRRVTLTDKGRIFLDRCRQLIDERDEAFGSANEHSEPAGELKLTCPAAMGERFIAPIALKFCALYPGVSINIDMTNRMVDLVGEGFDLAVRTGRLESSRLVGTRIGFRRLVTCASTDYLNRTSRPRDLSDLALHDCIIGVSQSWNYDRSGTPHIFRPKGRWRCNSGDSLLDATLAGMGICQIPEFYVRSHVRAGRLEIVLEDFEPAQEPIWVVYPHRRRIPATVRALIELLRLELPKIMHGDAGVSDKPLLT